MNKSALEYKAYLGLVEGKITQGEHKKLLQELSFLSRLGTSLKSLARAGGEIFGNVKKIYNDENFKALSAKIGKQIQLSAEEIKDIGRKLEIPEDQVNFMLAKVLVSAAGIKPQTITQVATNKPPTGDEQSGDGADSDKKPAGGGSAPPASQPITTAAAGGNEEILRQILQAVGELKGMSLPKAAAAAEKAIDKGEVKPKAVYSGIVKGISAMSGVDAGKVDKVYKWLETNKHIRSGESGAATVGECYASRSLKPIIWGLRNASSGVLNEDVTVARWQHLAGINESLIVEKTGQDLEKEANSLIDAGKIKSQAELFKRLPGVRRIEQKRVRNILKRIKQKWPSETAAPDANKDTSQETQKSSQDEKSSDESASKGNEDLIQGLIDDTEKLKKQIEDQKNVSTKEKAKSLLQLLLQQQHIFSKLGLSSAEDMGKRIPGLKDALERASNQWEIDKVIRQVKDELNYIPTQIDIVISKQKFDQDKIKDFQLALEKYKGQEEELLNKLKSEKGEKEELASKLTSSEARAQQLASELESNKEESKKFVADLAGSLGIDPETLKAQISEKGLSAVISAAMKKDPEAVSDAAAAAGVSTQPSGGSGTQKGRKKFVEFLPDMRKQISVEDVSDDDAKAVLNALDSLESLRAA